MLAEAPMYEPRQGSAFLLLDYSADNATFVEIGPQTPIVRRSSENGGLAETTRRLECERAKAQKPPCADVAHVKKSDRDAKRGDGCSRTGEGWLDRKKDHCWPGRGGLNGSERIRTATNPSGNWSCNSRGVLVITIDV
ncbi:hypothetical protein BHM03_00047981 [Ensete ventricosum]|nr:hypothetical protein BHM03_00047981 [Ensete ventricosum]